MSALSRAPRLVTAAVATCAATLAVAAPGIAKPAGTGVGAAAAAAAHAEHPADLRGAAGVQTGSLAGTSEANLGASIGTRSDGISAPADGTATLVVILIAGGAMFAGASAGFAGARRGALRTS
jgi:hypothetical protein